MQVKNSLKYKTVEIEFSVLTALILIVKCLFFIFFSSFIAYASLVNLADMFGEFPANARLGITLISSFVTIFYYFFPTILASNINVNLEEKGALTLLFDYTIGFLLKYFLAIIMIPVSYLLIKIFNRKEGSLRYGWTFSDVVESYFHDLKVDSNLEKSRIDVFGTSKSIQHPHLMWIFLLNLFFGFTFIFYIIALVWATNPKKVKVPIGDSEESTYFTDDFEKLERINKKSTRGFHPHGDIDKKEPEVSSTDNTKDQIGELDNEESFKIRLEKIEKLYAQGILTELEYQEQRRRIISEI